MAPAQQATRAGTARVALSPGLAATTKHLCAAPASARTAAPDQPVALSATLSRAIAPRSVETATVALQRLWAVQLSLSARWQLLRDEPVRRGDVASRGQRWLQRRFPGRPGRP